MKIQFTKEEIINAINEIDNNPNLITGRQSSTYDLVFKNKKYPPILVLSIANKVKNNDELTLSDFGNKVEIPFKILRDNGFKIEVKTSQMKPNLKDFIKISNEQITGKGTTDSAKFYARENKEIKQGLNTEISFGVGRASAIPWIAFIGFDQTIKNGIYPVYLYYKEYQKLILAYGVSETHEPLINWNSLDSKQTISEYFKKQFSKKPERYGSSYIFKVYDTQNLPAENLLEADLDKIIDSFKKQFKDKEKHISEKETSVKNDFSVSQFQSDLKKSGLALAEILVIRFVSALMTKPFVILTGLSGSGKTKLAQAFVKWICTNENQYCVVPVGADWTNREPLLGYPNALDHREYVKPDSGVLDLVMEANKNPELPHFLILDEMNLSHVERYFADFLSVMESKEGIPLHNLLYVKSAIPSMLYVPANLFIVGTVNIDETTNMFSPKVLDRANTIEFRVTEQEMANFLGNIRDVDMNILNTKGATMADSFLEMASNKLFEVSDVEATNETLVKFFRELKKTGAEFGYRSAREILRLINQLTVLDNQLTANEKLDIAIIQKLLPKLHGSRRKLCPVLESLGSLCISGKFKIIKDIFEKEAFDFDDANVLYPLSLEKITRMYKGAIDNGFASFAEA